jgi:hypothetical protein
VWLVGGGSLDDRARIARRPPAPGRINGRHRSVCIYGVARQIRPQGGFYYEPELTDAIAKYVIWTNASMYRQQDDAQPDEFSGSFIMFAV